MLLKHGICVSSPVAYFVTIAFHCLLRQAVCRQVPPLATSDPLPLTCLTWHTGFLDASSCAGKACTH